MPVIHNSTFLVDKNHKLRVRYTPELAQYFDLDFSREKSGYVPTNMLLPLIQRIIHVNEEYSLIMLDIHGHLWSLVHKELTKLSSPQAKNIIVHKGRYGGRKRTFMFLLDHNGNLHRGEIRRGDLQSISLKIVARDVAFITIYDGLLIRAYNNGIVDYHCNNIQLSVPIKLLDCDIVVSENGELISFDVGRLCDPKLHKYLKNECVSNVIEHPLGKIVDLIHNSDRCLDNAIILDDKGCAGNLDYTTVDTGSLQYKTYEFTPLDDDIAKHGPFLSLAKIDGTMHLEGKDGIYYSYAVGIPQRIPFKLKA